MYIFCIVYNGRRIYGDASIPESWMRGSVRARNKEKEIKREKGKKGINKQADREEINYVEIIRALRIIAFIVNKDTTTCKPVRKSDNPISS